MMTEKLLQIEEGDEFEFRNIAKNTSGRIFCKRLFHIIRLGRSLTPTFDLCVSGELV